MERDFKERCIKLGEYMVEAKSTIRQTAQKFGMKKSTVYKDVTEILLKYDVVLAREVRAVLDENKRLRYIRSGEATRKKYEMMRENFQTKK